MVKIEVMEAGREESLLYAVRLKPEVIRDLFEHLPDNQWGEYLRNRVFIGLLKDIPPSEAFKILNGTLE